MKERKIGRNEPCSCGSGVKYKKCCGSPTARQQNDNQMIPDPEYMNNMLRQVEAKEKQRIEQQGYGHPIISFESNGYRVVAVGNRLFWAKKPGQWKTFHDFLKWYIIETLKGEWSVKEMKKPLEDRHPILQWHDHWEKIKNATEPDQYGYYGATMTGAIAAYFGLAYNLFLIAHNNTDIQSKLIRRLQNRDQFHGAYYETYVAACFINAGFELEYEDEGDGSSKHCEFVAICKESGQKYSVEAKTRSVAGVLGKKDGKISDDPNVRNQLYEALKKDVAHPRIVFIDVNVPADSSEDGQYLVASLETVKAAEETMTINKKPAPPAYVVLTNHTNEYNRESSSFHWAALFASFKIEDFQHGNEVTLREAIDSREKHKDIHKLMKSMKEHYVIPETYDGENPEYAFQNSPMPRLIIGNTYLVPDGTGQEAPGVLEDAVVMENEKSVWGIFRFPDGRRGHIKGPLTDNEMAAYRRHPTTFFGVYKQKQRSDTPLELYDFFHESFKNMPHEKLLEKMQNDSSFEKFKEMSQEQLASIYAERITINALVQREAPPKGKEKLE